MLKMKRMICCVLIVAMCISSNQSALANERVNSNSLVSDEIKSEIVNALVDTEPIKEEMGLSEVDYYNIYVSNPILTYEYTKEGLLKSSTKYYPLKSDNVLFAWAIEYEDAGEIFYQISTALVQETNTVADNHTMFAFIFDKNGSYLYDGISIKHLKDSICENKERKVLRSLSGTEADTIELYHMKEIEKLEYSVPISARAQILYKCNVNVVSQDPSPNLCWAASIACIVNSIRGTNYTAVDVARKHYGDSLYDNTITRGTEASILAGRYGLNYTYKASNPTITNVVYNINKSYPVYGNFAASGQGHAVVIYGINSSTGVTYIMDPQNGFCTGRYNSTNNHYAYYKADVQTTYTSNSATCRYWN